MNDFFKITAAVFLGALLAMLAHEQITAIRLEYTMDQALRKSQVGAKVQQDRLLNLQREQARQNSEAQVVDQLRVHGLQLDAEREKQALEAKERAFDRYFTPSPTCRNDPSSVDCGNTYIRARAEFERQYRPAN